MKRAIVLKHAPFEGPARIAALLDARGYQLDVREVFRGAAVPSRLDEGELLVVMGGPMGVADLGNPEHGFLERELDLLGWCAEVDAPVLSVCLGAQLLAAAAGAAVHAMLGPEGERHYEVGWAPLRFLHTSPDDSILAGMPVEAQMLHWHGDTFELPRGARLLASSARCPNQAFQLRSRLFALQFHCEVAAQDVEGFLRADLEFAVRANGPDAAARIRRDTERNLSTLNALGDLLLGNILAAMTGPRMAHAG
jgi:GMP synthase-like glutamine amidotransferase